MVTVKVKVFPFYIVFYAEIIEISGTPLNSFPDSFPLFAMSRRILNAIKFPHLVGSSKNIIGGLLTNSRAIESLFFCPPLKFEVMVR